MSTSNSICVACEGNPISPNDPCFICGISSISTDHLLREPSWKEMEVFNRRTNVLNSPEGADLSYVNAQKKAIGEMLANRLSVYKEKSEGPCSASDSM